MFSQKKKMELALYKMTSITGTHKNEKFYKLFFLIKFQNRNLPMYFLVLIT